MARYIIAITGASGVVYGVRLVEELLTREYEIHLVLSEAARVVLHQEMDWEVNQELPLSGKNLRIYENSNIAAPIASGSFLVDGMVVIPCSMASVSALAQGAADNLLERAADVMLKERRPLIIVPRETPLNTIHLRNLLTLSEIGVHIIPAMPGFYSHPQTIDDIVNFIVGKVLDAMEINHNLFKRYNGLFG
ncbi:UbiX family flavin prenyltransferase [Syntrophomonas erecta]